MPSFFGDVILMVDGLPMTPTNVRKFRDGISQMTPGTPFKVTIYRAGEVLGLTGKAP